VDWVDAVDWVDTVETLSRDWDATETEEA
jgi:hypothetical protein